MTYALHTEARVSALIVRWKRRLHDAEKNRDDQLRANAHRALEALDLSVQEGSNPAGRYAIPDWLEF